MVRFPDSKKLLTARGVGTVTGNLKGERVSCSVTEDPRTKYPNETTVSSPKKGCVGGGNGRS